MAIGIVSISNFHFRGIFETWEILFLIANGSLQILLGTDDVFEHLTTVNLIGIGFFQFKKYLHIKVWYYSARFHCMFQEKKSSMH